MSTLTKTNTSNNYITNNTVNLIVLIVEENIFAHIVAGFESLNIEEGDWKTTVWTTDRAANMKATFSCYRRLDCVAHVINTCVRYTVAGDDTPLAVLRFITSHLEKLWNHAGTAKTQCLHPLTKR